MENTKIAKKLLAVMDECAYVVKNGLNSFHKYKYATAEDVLQKVNEALTKNKIACNLKGNTEHLATVKVEITLIDGDSGEEVKIYGIGSGQDAGDKAVMKAQTAATKYAYMLSFCIATGDDPEADSKTDENNYAEPQNNIKHRAAVKPQPKAGNNIITCTGCGNVITNDRVVEYSIKNFGRPLCRECQKTAIKAA